MEEEGTGGGGGGDAPATISINPNTIKGISISKKSYNYFFKSKLLFFINEFIILILQWPKKKWEDWMFWFVGSVTLFFISSKNFKNIVPRRELVQKCLILEKTVM